MKFVSFSVQPTHASAGDSGTISRVTRDEQHPTAASQYSRRKFLVGAIAVGLAPALGGCTYGRQREVDPLYQLLYSAQRDVRTARALAGSTPRMADVITVREEHIAALQEEIARQEKLWAHPTDPTSSSPHATSSLTVLRRHLNSASQEALNVVAKSAGYRAGLAGSIAASCNALAQVVF